MFLLMTRDRADLVKDDLFKLDYKIFIKDK